MTEEAKMQTSKGSVDATPRFEECKAVAKLHQLASNPFDLTGEGGLTPERVNTFVSEACGLKLLYATERVDERVISVLEDLAGETRAVEKMQQMQNGEVINSIEGYPSENRAVLHTAMRDFFEVPSMAKAAQEAAALAKEELHKLQVFTEDIEGKFTDMVMIGIGGSDLGPRALYLALEKYHTRDRHVHFIANIDPDDAAMVLKGVDLAKTLVVIVSKSGTTLETLTNEEIVRARFSQAGLDPNRHCVAVTGQGSPMDDPSRYLESFYIWDYVGGRYSATSMVGGVMLAFGVGYDNFWDLLHGASAMDKVALDGDVKKNLPLLSALLGIWNRNFLGYPTVVVVPYSQLLHRFPAHLQQCDMESNGKQIDKRGRAVDFQTGPVVWGEPGTNGQHSFFQLIHQGTTPVPAEFIGFSESQFSQDIEVQGTSSQEKLLSNLFAQALALAVGQKSDNPNQNFPGNRPSRVLLGQKLTPYTLGALLAYYEHKVAFQGFVWNINSFDQEGVQLGKILATKFLDVFKGKTGDFSIGEALLKQLPR